MITIKTCPLCENKWNNVEEILTDPKIRFNGFQENVIYPLNGSFLFTHLLPQCQTTFLIKATSFIDYIENNIFQKEALKIENCEPFYQIMSRIRKIAKNQYIKFFKQDGFNMNTKTVSNYFEKTNIQKIITCSKDDYVITALNLMKKNKISCLMIVDDKDHLCGIFTEKDILTKCYNNNSFISPNKTTINSVMSKEVNAINLEDHLSKCALLFVSKNIRHLPVINNDLEPVGMISIRDVFSQLADWI